MIKHAFEFVLLSCALAMSLRSSKRDLGLLGDMGSGLSDGWHSHNSTNAPA